MNARKRWTRNAPLRDYIDAKLPGKLPRGDGAAVTLGEVSSHFKWFYLVTIGHFWSQLVTLVTTWSELDTDTSVVCGQIINPVLSYPEAKPQGL